MNIKYKGNELEVRGGAWCDPMNGFAFNVLEREVIDDNKTGSIIEQALEMYFNNN